MNRVIRKNELPFIIEYIDNTPDGIINPYTLSFIKCLSDAYQYLVMKVGHSHHINDLNTRMDACGVPPHVKDAINKCVLFHTAPAPGVLIGAFMIDYAMDLLGITPDQKIYGVCETPKCLPDALQVIAHCTTGNNRLTIVPIGKFAITLNTATKESAADAVRVYVDLEKLKKFPVIDIWYANSPEYNKATMNESLQMEIFRAGRQILSFEHVRIKVSGKKKWKSVTCPCCGETVPDYLIEGDHCGACGSMKYYEKIPG